MKALVFYHYLYPDDVISSVHFSDLCRGLVERGWKVTGCCCNRSCRNPEQTFPRTTTWHGVRIVRIWRPKFKQSTSLGRVLNSAWMIVAWSLLALNPFLVPSHLIIGTDPVMSILVALPWKLLKPRIRIVHWCFDLYPEAAFADQLISDKGLAIRVLRRALSAAYARCETVADLGPCMKAALSKYLGPNISAITIPVWAIVEPECALPIDESESRQLFGDAQLGLLYSGSIGKAHSYEEVLDLARQFTPREAKFVFSARGNRSGELAQAIKTASKNVSMAEFAEIDALEKRLASAAIHIVTLRPEWTGAVVPSKFFGAIAMGRPVLFIGSASSSIARWIEEFQVGWVLESSSAAGYHDQIERIVRELRSLAAEPARVEVLFTHCHSVYQQQFVRQRLLNMWHQELLGLTCGGSHSVA